MKNKTSFSLLSTMFFNVSYFQATIPKLLIGNRCFKIDFNADDGSSLIVRTYDDFLNEQAIFFNIKNMRVESITVLSTGDQDVSFFNFIHRTVIPRKMHSDFDTCKILDQFNLYVQYIILSFNFMYWR